MKKKVILIVRDGWGHREKSSKNIIKSCITNFISKKNKIECIDAIKSANTKYTDEFEKKYPTIYLSASGKDVGLPEGYMGNSEVGHMTMGAGRPILQSLERINKSIEKKDFIVDKKILKTIQNIKKNNSQLHLVILMEDSGVHSEIQHLFETLKFCKKEGLKNDQVILHLITDGRDNDPKSGIAFLAEVGEKMEKFNVGNVGTISGRFFAMDRNNNLDRTEKYFDSLFFAKSEYHFSCGVEKINEFYEKNITDEFLPPMIKKGYNGVSKNDSIFVLNFRKDRMIQIATKISEKKEEYNLEFLTMTNFSKNINSEVVFDNIKVDNILGDILEKNNKKQLRISETEKYAHVTFFFDGGIVKKNIGKKEILIKSPNVKTYDKKPEMSSEELSEKIIFEIENKDYDFILINFPNADMVGHTGNIEATKKAIEAVDKSVKKVVDSALNNNYITILTADHGNAEEISKNFTSHTINKVPLTLISKEKIELKKGTFSIGNIAPTILELMKIKKPKEFLESFLKSPT